MVGGDGRHERPCRRQHHDGPDQLSDDQQTLLDGEQYIRDVLEQARKVRVVAERHLGQPASEATFVVSPSWKRTMAQAALSFIQDLAGTRNSSFQSCKSSHWHRASARAR